MEIDTTVLKIAESHYVRIPASMCEYFKLDGKATARIKDISKDKAEISFVVG